MKRWRHVGPLIGVLTASTGCSGPCASGALTVLDALDDDDPHHHHGHHRGHHGHHRGERRTMTRYEVKGSGSRQLGGRHDDDDDDDDGNELAAALGGLVVATALMAVGCAAGEAAAGEEPAHEPDESLDLEVGVSPRVRAAIEHPQRVTATSTVIQLDGVAVQLRRKSSRATYLTVRIAQPTSPDEATACELLDLGDRRYHAVHRRFRDHEAQLYEIYSIRPSVMAMGEISRAVEPTLTICEETYDIDERAQGRIVEFLHTSATAAAPTPAPSPSAGEPH